MGLQQSVATSAPAEDGEGNTLISSNSSDSPDEEIRNKSDSFSFTQYFFKRRKRKKMELEDNISSKGDSDKKKIRQDKVILYKYLMHNNFSNKQIFFSRHAKMKLWN